MPIFLSIIHKLNIGGYTLLSFIIGIIDVVLQFLKSIRIAISQIKGVLASVIIYQKNKSKKYKLNKSWLFSYIDKKFTLKKIGLNYNIHYFLIFNFLFKDEQKIYSIHKKLQAKQ